MRKSGVVVTLSDGGLILKKWEEPCETDTPEIIKTVTNVKHSLNDYLTEMIDNGAKDQAEVSETSDVEEDIEGDDVTGFIKGIAPVNEKFNSGKGRKSNYSIEAKKRKK